MSAKKSIRSEKTPPRKTKNIEQMIDIRGFLLTTEQGAPLVTETESYRRSEYGKDTAPSVVLDSDSYRLEGRSTSNVFSKGNPAALPVEEQFAVESEVSRTLLGINRETTQQGLFGNVSTYGLDPKDWRVDIEDNVVDGRDAWWIRRPSSTGNYYPAKYEEDDRNSAIVLSSNPTPFLSPVTPTIQDLLLLSDNVGERYTNWGQYINSVVALKMIKFMVEEFTPDQWERFSLLTLISKYPPLKKEDGKFEFNGLYWDKLWLDIQQNRFGTILNNPIFPKGKAYNFNDVQIPNWRSNSSLWGTSNVFISGSQILNFLPVNLDVSWDSFFFSTTRIYFPPSDENKGHYILKTGSSGAWESYFALRYNELRQDLKDWEFTIHKDESTVTNVEKELKLPYFVLDNPIVPDESNRFSNFWPSDPGINLPTNNNRIGGSQGIRSNIVLKSVRSFRYQPGRISGFTYGAKVSEIGAGPGTILEFGIENDTDAYMFRLTDGALFSIVRRSTVPLENTVFLKDSGYAENTRVIGRNGVVQYETVIEQKFMNGDSLSGEGQTGYILNPDTVTMYKIEFGWYGAIGARFYAYVPVGNNECRWITMHTLVIENQLGKPCLADPFFYFKYRLSIQDSSTVRVDQFIHKFGSSYYIDGYDEGTLYSSNSQSKVRRLPNPELTLAKTRLNAIDWVTIMGIKPVQFLVNRYGRRIYNKKEIFPENFNVYSQQDCEIKIVRQTGCPEWAYSHQEGYRWLPIQNNRRLRGKFSISRYFQSDLETLGISANDVSTHTAVITYLNPVDGFRSPVIESNWSHIGNQPVKVSGSALYNIFSGPVLDFSGGLNVKLLRAQDAEYFSSRNPVPNLSRVYLPSLYPLAGATEDGYEIEFDYFRRDQILFSSVDVVSDEFFIYWVGGSNTNYIRMGFTWPDSGDNTIEEYDGFDEFPTSGQDLNTIYLDTQRGNTYTWDGEKYNQNLFLYGSSSEWGIEKNAEYDEFTFGEGLPYDFAFDYPDNTLYMESGRSLARDFFGFEVGEYNEWNGLNTLFYRETTVLSVPGSEGGICRGYSCKTSREIRENVSLISEVVDGVLSYYLVDTESPWPSLGDKTFVVTVTQGNSSFNVTCSSGDSRETGDTVQYLMPVLSLPQGLNLGQVNVTYTSFLIGNIDPKSEIRQLLVTKVGPGNIPFVRPFIQARGGTALGGVWVGQRRYNGIEVVPFTPHRCTLSISDTEIENHLTAGIPKSIGTYTHIDRQGVSTAPTNNPDPLNLDTNKSINTSPKKCGSFLSSGAVNSAGIFTESEYPIRWLTSGLGNPIATYYVSANTPTEIDMSDIFNVSGESIVNQDYGNLATFFIARSLSNHNETDNEIYISLNYNEQ